MAEILDPQSAQFLELCKQVPPITDYERQAIAAMVMDGKLQADIEASE